MIKEKVEETNNLRYQVYELDIKGNLGKPLTIPIPTKERALTYYEECFHCALVSIDENGTIIEVLEKNLEPKDIKDKKPKIIKRNL